MALLSFFALMASAQTVTGSSTQPIKKIMRSVKNNSSSIVVIPAGPTASVWLAKSKTGTVNGSECKACGDMVSYPWPSIVDPLGDFSHWQTYPSPNFPYNGSDFAPGETYRHFVMVTTETTLVKFIHGCANAVTRNRYWDIIVGADQQEVLVLP